MICSLYCAGLIYSAESHISKVGGIKRGIEMQVYVACACVTASLTCYAPSREGNGIERCRIIDILISRPCGDGNAEHSLNCMD